MFFIYTATTEFYPLSLHDALPIWAKDSRAKRSRGRRDRKSSRRCRRRPPLPERASRSSPVSASSCSSCSARPDRSEEHTSELQSRQYLVCRLLLEKKKTNQTTQQL